MVALDYEKQIRDIERETSRSLQAIAIGMECPELAGFLIYSIARIYVLIHDREQSPGYQAEAVLELVEEVQLDRYRNFFQARPTGLPDMQNPIPEGVGQRELRHE